MPTTEPPIRDWRPVLEDREPSHRVFPHTFMTQHPLPWDLDRGSIFDADDNMVHLFQLPPELVVRVFNEYKGVL